MYPTDCSITMKQWDIIRIYPFSSLLSSNDDVVMIGISARVYHPFFTHQFKLNYPPYEYVKKALLLTHIRLNMKSLREQNLSLYRNGFDKIEEDDLRDIALERGIKNHELSEIKNRLKFEWNVAIKELKDYEDLQFWMSVINYHKWKKFIWLKVTNFSKTYIHTSLFSG